MLQLSTLKDTQKGRRCFILGNGPSLNKTNLELLRDEFTIGLNRIYLKFPDMGYATNAICCVNEHVLRQFGSEIAAQPGIKLLSSRAAENLGPKPNTIYMEAAAGVGFNTDLSNHTWYSGATVTFCALQLAYHMGFEEVVLLGVDHNFKQSGRAHLESKSTGNDVNHFDPQYFGKNVIWQFPDLLESEINYTVAREVFRIDGRKIVDGTVGGKLSVFEKITGYATNHTDERPIDTVARSTDLGVVVPKRPIAEFLVYGRFKKSLRPVGLATLMLGLIWLVAQMFTFPWMLPLVLSLLLIAIGASLAAGEVLLEALSEQARKRRLKEGQTLVQTLKLIREPAARN